jgi:aspartyl-tRNA(Asn)/glutamyl-tRNA(Gln) amidotransferase subunit C
MDRYGNLRGFVGPSHPTGFPWFFPKILPMPLAIEDVARIAHLARIHISDEEAERTLAQLNDIFAMIEQMRAVDTTGVEPMAHPLGGSQRLRDDVATEPDWREAAMQAPRRTRDGLFLVPKVIE